MTALLPEPCFLCGRPTFGMLQWGNDDEFPEKVCDLCIADAQRDNPFDTSNNIDKIEDAILAKRVKS